MKAAFPKRGMLKKVKSRKSGKMLAVSSCQSIWCLTDMDV